MTPNAMLTEQETQRIAEIFVETAGLPIGDRVRRVRAKILYATDDDIRQALKTCIELTKLDKINAEIEIKEIERGLEEIEKNESEVPVATRLQFPFRCW